MEGKVNDPDLILIIAGRVLDKNLKMEIEKKVHLIPNIIKKLTFVDDCDVQYLFNSSDLVVLPFKDILNSGSAMLSLTFKKPLLCPNIGSLIELKNMFPSGVVNTYDELSLQNIDHIICSSKIPSSVVLDQFNNKKLANLLKEFYLKFRLIKK